MIDRDEVNFLLDLNTATRQSKNHPTWNDLLIESILHHFQVIEAQRAMIERQRDEITSCIRYAKRIQGAMMPSVDEVQALFPEHVIFFKPRDIVSSDFYWLKRIDDKVFIVVADCTGHGVPGALLCMLGISSMNIIVRDHASLTPGEVLSRLRDSIKTMLS